MKKEKLERKIDDVRTIDIKSDGKKPPKEIKRRKHFWNRGKHNRSFGFIGNWRLRKKPEESYVITMKFANGTSKTWIISTKKHTFKVKNKLYYLYYEEADFDISLNQYHLYYHERYAVPINREILQSDENEAFFNVTPSNLQSLIKFEYVKVLAQAQSLSSTLRFVLVLSFVCVVASGLNLLISTGIIKIG